MTDLDDLLVDNAAAGWLLYRLPDGRGIRVDVDVRHPLRWCVDVEGGDQVDGLTTDQVEALLRREAGGRA
ncbi:hypothetical protein Vqi01_34830 [Micromonospora qiuiae]|uniref:Uncharacterized protein n=1 Tax=Micromonospora qiuiae TaxID=502268 RepID=A0ABQ4JDQ7_9ACTN|nr:hypothetical protein [Micromonospora qiuiae]GIJ28321.1 hypothetical protein Vqi01_34830 [Micromonospora qiuiae]